MASTSLIEDGRRPCLKVDFINESVFYFMNNLTIIIIEGGLRVPFFLKYPSKIAASTNIAATVSHVDIFTTSLAAAG